MTDIEIAHNTEMLPIKDIATRVGIENYLEYYGEFKAKVKYDDSFVTEFAPVRLSMLVFSSYFTAFFSLSKPGATKKPFFSDMTSFPAKLYHSSLVFSAQPAISRCCTISSS